MKLITDDFYEDEVIADFNFDLTKIKSIEFEEEIIINYDFTSLEWHTPGLFNLTDRNFNVIKLDIHILLDKENPVIRACVECEEEEYIPCNALLTKAEKIDLLWYCLHYQNEKIINIIKGQIISSRKN